MSFVEYLCNASIKQSFALNAFKCLHKLLIQMERVGVTIWLGVSNSCKGLCVLLSLGNWQLLNHPLIERPIEHMDVFGTKSSQHPGDSWSGCETQGVVADYGVSYSDIHLFHRGDKILLRRHHQWNSSLFK